MLQIVFTAIIVLLGLSTVIMAVISEANNTSRYTEHGRNENITAIISLPNGEVIEGCPDWYRIDVDSDKVRVVINGVEYRTSFGNVVFIEVKE